jgi:hypothetical protein
MIADVSVIGIKRLITIPASDIDPVGERDIGTVSVVAVQDTFYKLKEIQETSLFERQINGVPRVTFTQLFALNMRVGDVGI